MAQKDSQYRLLIPNDIWNLAEFDSYVDSTFGFFITDDSRVAIMNLNVAQTFDYEFLGYCSFDEKHRFLVPRNVDTYLGLSNTYYFTAELDKSMIYIYKLQKSILQERQCAQMEKLLSTIS